MSQLDYLWVNYGNFQVSTTPNDNPNNILTQEAIKSLLQEFSSIKSVQIIDKEGLKYLVVTNNDNTIINEQPIPSGISIKNFGKRQITQSDRDKGCELPLNSYVYFILLTDGNEYLAPIDRYYGYESRTIITDIINNSVYAELKINNQDSIISISDTTEGVKADLLISNKSEGVLLSKTQNGLEGNIILQNSDKFLKFSLLTIEEYEELSLNNLIDDTTMYFIKGAKFFYFGKYLMAGSDESVVLDNYYTKSEINSKLSNYITKDELQSRLDEVIINWNNI